MAALDVTIADDIANVTLVRGEVHNAFDDALIADLTAAFHDVGANPSVRVVILAAEGKSFSAGADLNWMRRMAGYSEAENVADAKALAGLMQTIDTCPKPTIARVQGAAFGGGVGLVACCDIAVASDRASFCLSEVKLGIVPAVISPYIVRAIGPRAARRYVQTAERFGAVEAHRLGLVHEVAAEDALDAVIGGIVDALRQGGPEAQREAKLLVALVADRDPAEVLDETARRIAVIRAGAEGQEGLTAFLEKRPPVWVRAGDRRTRG
ncbi:MAG: enoyl-CoA hydratase/isomerase family protein [Pseudomonadota bacterium]